MTTSVMLAVLVIPRWRESTKRRNRTEQSPCPPFPKGGSSAPSPDALIPQSVPIPRKKYRCTPLKKGVGVREAGDGGICF